MTILICLLFFLNHLLLVKGATPNQICNYENHEACKIEQKLKRVWCMKINSWSCSQDSRDMSISYQCCPPNIQKIVKGNVQNL
jgi:hypothetical protein